MSIMDNFKDFPILETNRLILRKCMNEDLSGFYKVASNQNVTKWITWEHHKSKDETQSFIDLLSGKYADGTCTVWAICKKDSNIFMGLISFVYINEKNFRSEIGYWLGEEYWNKGYTAEAAEKIIDFGFNTLGLHRITAGHFAENPASGRLMQKVGMKCEGICHDEAYHRGKFYDIVRYAIVNK